MDAHLKYSIETNPEIANETEYDHTKIGLTLSISYGLKMFKLLLLISNLTYFLGLIWLIYCQLIDHYSGHH